MEQRQSGCALIVCREVERPRFLAWAKLLIAADAEVVLVKCEGDICFRIDRKNLSGGGEGISCSKLPRQVTAALVHSGDHELWEEALQAEIKASKVFWFNTPGDPSPPGGHYPVCRTTSSVNFDVTEQDALEILDYALGKRKELPACCTPKLALDYLPSLAILCQGYLAVHAEHKKSNKDWKDEDIKSALEKMGWTTFASHDEASSSLVRIDLGERVDEVRDPKWWLSVFGLWDEKSENVISDEKRLGQFKTAVEEEWDQMRRGKVPAGLNDLIETLEKGENPSPRQVADAYCLLAQRLGGGSDRMPQNEIADDRSSNRR